MCACVSVSWQSISCVFHGTISWLLFECSWIKNFICNSIIKLRRFLLLATLSPCALKFPLNYPFPKYRPPFFSITIPRRILRIDSHPQNSANISVYKPSPIEGKHPRHQNPPCPRCPMIFLGYIRGPHARRPIMVGTISGYHEPPSAPGIS